MYDKKSYDIEVAWQINEFCNFDCVYCWLHERDWENSKRFVGLQDTEKVINGFNKTGFAWLIHMSGGEPFFFPNFLQVCYELTKKHFISINTNLSHKDVFEFSKIINPEKVDFIHASLHIQERIKCGQVQDFIDKYRVLRKRGFNIFVSYLMYPESLDRFRKDYDYFKSKGIILRPKVFWGEYYGIFKIFDSIFFREFNHFKPIRNLLKKTYPNAYTKKQKQLINFYIEKSSQEEDEDLKFKRNLRIRTVDLNLDKKWINSLISFKGMNCSAGKDFVKMDQTGGVVRCIDENQYQLGNLFGGEVELFREPRRCSADICSCPYVGCRYVCGNTIVGGA
jgi:organic radical activating enzyme